MVTNDWCVTATHLTGFLLAIPFGNNWINPYYLKSDISAKLKAQHVHVSVFYAKQNRIPDVGNIDIDDQRYIQTGSEFRVRNITGLDCNDLITFDHYIMCKFRRMEAHK